MNSSKYMQIKLAMSLLLVVTLLGSMTGPVTGNNPQLQSSIQTSEPLTISGSEDSESGQQDGTIEMDHVRVAIRASETKVTTEERVQISYDGVALNSNPEPLDILIIADIPSGMTVSGMQAEGCYPQCPISDEQLQPGDRLQPGSFTITPQEPGTHTIELRTGYTLHDESSKNHNATTTLTISAQKPTSPPGFADRIGSALGVLDSGSPFSIFVVTVTLFILVLVLSRLVSQESERLVIGIAGLVLISGIAIAGIGAINISPDTTAKPSSGVDTTDSTAPSTSSPTSQSEPNWERYRSLFEKYDNCYNENQIKQVSKQLKKDSGGASPDNIILNEEDGGGQLSARLQGGPQFGTYDAPACDSSTPSSTNDNLDSEVKDYDKNYYELTSCTQDRADEYIEDATNADYKIEENQIMYITSTGEQGEFTKCLLDEDNEREVKFDLTYKELDQCEQERANDFFEDPKELIYSLENGDVEYERPSGVQGSYSQCDK